MIVLPVAGVHSTARQTRGLRMLGTEIYANSSSSHQTNVILNVTGPVGER